MYNYDEDFRVYVTKKFLKRHFPKKRLRHEVGFAYGYVIPSNFSGNPERRFIAKNKWEMDDLYIQLHNILEVYLGMSNDEIAMTLVMYLR